MMSDEQEDFITQAASDFHGLFNVPGQGLVAQISVGGVKQLFDFQGLQFRILELRKLNFSSDVEEKALQQLSVFEEIS